MASEVIIRCKNSNASLTLEPTDIGKLVTDNTITLQPMSDYCMTKGRLNDIIEKYKNLKDEDSLCSIPKTSKYEVTELNGVYTLTVEMTPYESQVAYPYGGSTIVVEYVKEGMTLPTDYKNYKIHYGDKYVNIIKIDLHPEMINKDLKFKVGYITGKKTVSSTWTTFRVNQATVIGPEIEPITSSSIEYQNRPPYGFSFTAKTIDKNEDVNKEHVSTTWKIYSKKEDKLQQVWTKVRTDTDKESIRIANLVPQYLTYGNTYYITSTHYYSNGEYSTESTPVPFTIDGVVLQAPPKVDIYPGKITIPDPTFACSDEIELKVNKKSIKLDTTSMEKYFWELKGPKGTKKYSTVINQVKISKDLEPNTTYDLIVTYKHLAVGLSPETKITFTTEPEFRLDPAGLDNPIRIYNKTAFYGEVLQKDLMSNNIRYRGYYREDVDYEIGDEVSKDGILYVCRRRKQGSLDAFKNVFDKADAKVTNSLYKSELPTYRWLLNELGLNPYLSLNKVPEDSSLTNFLHLDTGAWLKCQNALGKIIYISKFNVYNGISHNDLIRANLYHPKRRTVRIRHRLYYARLICSTIESYYDPIDPVKKDKINTVYGSSTVDVKEEELMTYLLNGRLFNYVSTDLDASTIDYKEIIYTHNKLLASKIVTGNSVSYGNIEITNPNERKYSLRLILEEIPNQELPIFNLNPDLPGKNGQYDEEGKLMEYDPYGDTCYLDFVTVDNFLSSESINEKTGLFMDICTPNLGWHKIYRKGLVYYVSQGQNYLNVDVKRMEEMNMLTPTPLYIENIKDSNEVKDTKYCKTIVNGLIFNVTVPEVVNYEPLHEVIIDSNEKEYNIMEGKKNKDLTIGDKSFWSNIMNNVIKEREDSPNPTAIGYKGLYTIGDPNKQSVEFITNNKSNGWFLTSKKLVKPDGTLSYILNSELDPYVMKECKEEDKVNVILTLTIVPTVGNKKIWGVK